MENQEPQSSQKIRKRRSHHKTQSRGPKANLIHVAIAAVLALMIAFYIVHRGPSEDLQASYSAN